MVDEYDREPLAPLSPRASVRKRIRELRIKFYWEQSYPYVLGVAAGAATGALFDLSGIEFDRLNQDVVPVSVTIAAILAAFQGASPAILISVGTSRAVRALRADGYYEVMIRYLRESIIVLFGYIAVSSVFLVINAVLPDSWPDGQACQWMFGALVMLFTTAFLTSYRITLLMAKLLSIDPAN